MSSSPEPPGEARTQTWPDARDAEPAPPPPGPPSLGPDLRLLDLLGRGGMGEVWLARDLGLDREVVVKVLRPRGPVDPVAEEALLRREALVTARLHHPGVVTVHRIARHEGRTWLVLERLHGEELEEAARAGRLLAVEALRCIAEAAETLAWCHAQGIAHRDLSPRNLWRCPDGRVKLLDLGLAQVAELGLAPSGGTPGYTPPERGVRGESALPGDVWALAAVLWRLLTGTPPSGGPLGRLPPELPESLCALLARAMDPRPDARPAMAAFAQALRQQEAQIRARGLSPFRYLDPFEEAHAALFFGREPEIGRLLGALDLAPLVLLVGPSGAGKSSLLRAGLLPRLRGRDVRALRVGEGLPPAGPSALPPVRLLDAAEELFTLLDGAEREARARALRESLDGGARLVLSLREEYLTRLLGLLGERDAERAQLIALLPPGREGLRQAIVAPVERCGGQVEPALIEELLAQVDGESAPLPLLQLACSRLWEARERPGDRLRLVHLRELGGLSGLLAAHAEEIVARLPGAAEHAQLDRLLLALVTAEGTRRPRRAEELLDPRAPEASARALEVLVRGRLLTRRGQGEEGRIELAHEALIERWDRLARLVAQAGRERQVAAQAEAAARTWEGAGRAPELLWQGPLREEAAALVVAHSALFSAEAHEFLGRSEARARRNRGRRQALLVGAFVGLGLVGLLSQAGLREVRAQAEVARQEAARAEAARAQAEARRLAMASTQALETDQRRALALAVEAWAGAPEVLAAEALREAMSRPWLRTSYEGNSGLVNDLSLSPDGALLASGAADGSLRIWRADGALVTAVQLGERGVSSVLWTPGGEALFAVDLDGTLQSFDREGRPLGEAGRVPGPCRALAFSPDGRFLALAAQDGAAWVLDRQSGAWRSLPGHEGFALNVAWRADGRRLLSTGIDGRLRLWSWPEARLLADPAVAGSGGIEALFLPDGGLAAGSWAEATLSLFDAEGRRLQRIPAHAAAISRLVLSPDGRRLATLSWDTTARLWSLDGRPGPVLPVQSGRVTDLAFSPDGQVIATTDDASGLRLWGLDGRRIARLSGHYSWVTRVRWAPDGAGLYSTGQDGSVRGWALDERTLAGLRDRRIEATRGRLGREPAEPTLWPEHPDHVHAVLPSGRELGVGYALADAPVSRIARLADGRVLTWSGDRYLRLWSEEGGHAEELLGHEGAVPAFAVAGEELLTVGAEGRAVRWDLRSGEEQARVETGEVLELAALASEGGVAAVGGRGGLWRWSPGEAARRLHDQPLTALGAVEGVGLVAGDADGALWAWSLEGAPLWRRPEVAPGRVEQVEGLGEGRLLVRADGGAALLDAEGRVLARHVREAGTPLLVVAPDRSRYLLADEEGGGALFDRAGQPLGELQGHEAAIVEARFLADGGLLTAGWDGRVIVRDARGEVGSVLDLRPHLITALELAPDGLHFAVARYDGEIHLWTLGGKHRGRLDHHDRFAMALAFDRRGERLRSWSTDAAVQVSELDPVVVAAAARRRLHETPEVEIQRGRAGQYGNLR